MSCQGCKGVSMVVHGVQGLAKAALRIDATPPTERENRLGKCRDCEHSTKHPTRKAADGKPLVRWCKLCKCLLTAKTKVASEACPDGRWPAVNKT